MNDRQIQIKKWYVVAFLAALVVRVLIAIPLTHDWDGFVFTETARNLVEGTTPYATVEENGHYIYTNSDRSMPQQWYAYPPVPALLFSSPYAFIRAIGFETTPLVENFLVKSIFILGDLVLAFLVFRFLVHRNERLAEQAMLLVLFNPLLIWVSSAWGMFDVWMLNFILLFLLTLRTHHFVLSGIFLALSVEVKLFALLFLPALLAYVIQTTTSISARLKVVISFVTTTLLVVLPFLLTHPQGFLNQNLLMHISRPPQGIGLIGILDYFSYVYEFDISLFVTFGGMSMLVLVLLFNVFAITLMRGDVSRLLLSLLFIYTSVLLCNKVVNEQYFVVLIGLLILLRFYRGDLMGLSNKFLKRFEIVATYSVLFASVVLGFHFLTFLSPFISEGYMEKSTNDLVYYLSNIMPGIPLYSYTNSIWTYYNLPIIATFVVLVPLLSMCAYVVAHGILRIFQARVAMFKSTYHFFHDKVYSFCRSYILLILSTILVLIVVTSLFMFYLRSQNAFQLIGLDDARVEEMPHNPTVGTLYYTWWNNATMRNAIPGDAWDRTTLTPSSGYYTSKNSYYVQHIQEMKELGIDFAVIAYHLYDRDRYKTFIEYADQMGLYAAPFVESVDVLAENKFRPVDPNGDSVAAYKLCIESQKEISELLVSALRPLQNKRNALRYKEKLIVFISDPHLYVPSWDEEYKKELALLVLQQYNNADDMYPTLSHAWNKEIETMGDVVREYPTSIHDFNNTDSQSNIDFKKAYQIQFNMYWDAVRKEIEQEVGSVYLVATLPGALPPHKNAEMFPREISVNENVFDNVLYNLPATWMYWHDTALSNQILHTWDEYIEQHVANVRGNNAPLILEVVPGHNDTGIRGSLGFEIPVYSGGEFLYDHTWKAAIKHEADFVLISSWNDFLTGKAIESTTEHGDFFQKETAYWITEYEK